MRDGLKIVFSAGGTAGHIFPTFEVIKALKEKLDFEGFYFGEKGSLEEDLAKEFGLKFIPTKPAKFHRFFNVENLLLPFKICFAFFSTFFALSKIKPSLIFGKGGYVSFPLVLANKFLKIPLILHESDAVLGLANRIGFSQAKEIFTGFPIENYPKNFQKKLVYTGIPVRDDFRRLRKIKLPKVNLKTIVIVGGSQGSLQINNLVLPNLSAWLKEYQVIHFTGERDYLRFLEYKKNLKQFQNRYQVIKFLKEGFVDRLWRADVVISRGGAGAISELAALGKATILIPILGSAGEHQLKNSQVLEKTEAAIVLQKPSPQELDLAVKKVLNDEDLQKELSENISRFFVENSAQKIVELIIEILTKR